jgi:hypothetical protein
MKSNLKSRRNNPPNQYCEGPYLRDRDDNRLARQQRHLVLFTSQSADMRVILIVGCLCGLVHAWTIFIFRSLLVCSCKLVELVFNERT